MSEEEHSGTPAMRSALLGCYFAANTSARRAHVAASTLLTLGVVNLILNRPGGWYPA